MRYLLLFVFISFLGKSYGETDTSQLRKNPPAIQKYTLLNFSGSDWCIPCIKMKKAIFQADTFQHYSAQHLVWINADFPRDRKKLSAEQIKKNEQLADKYNKNGSFPYTVLLDEKGNVIKSWDGFPNLTAEEFIQQVETAEKDEQSHHHP